MSRRRLKKSIKRLFVIILVIAVASALLFLCAKKAAQIKGESANFSRPSSSEDMPLAATTAKEAEQDALDYFFTSQGTVIIEEEEYVPKRSTTNLLFIGFDDETPPNADFLMLLSFNAEQGICNVIEINPYMEVLAPTDYSDVMGISIAESAKEGIPNLLQHCEHIFYGEIFDYYIAMNMKNTAELLVKLGIDPGELIVHTAQANRGFERTGYGRLFINSFIQYINDSPFTVDFLSDIWGFIADHSQTNGDLENMGQMFVDLKTFTIQKSWETPAIEYLNEFNLYKPENKPLVIKTFFTKVN